MNARPTSILFAVGFDALVGCGGAVDQVFAGVDAAVDAAESASGPAERGASTDATAVGSGDGGLGQACSGNEQCSTSFPVCFQFTAKGPECTAVCKTGADCPRGSGCNMMGVCKAP